MAYSTGSATGPSDLLDKIRAFSLLHGWIVNSFIADNTKYETWTGLDGTGYRLHMQKTHPDGAVSYINLRSTIRGIPCGFYNNDNTPEAYGYRAELTGIALYGSTAYSGALAWDKQVGHTDYGGKSWAGCTRIMSSSSVPSYHLFGLGETIICAIEYESGKYTWLGFGQLEKEVAGTYTGGQFWSGDYHTYGPNNDHNDDNNCGFQQGWKGSFSIYATGGVYVDVESVAGWRFTGSMANITGQSEACGVTTSHKSSSTAYSISNGPAALFAERNPSHFAQTTAMCRCYWLLKRQGVYQWSCIGEIPGMRLMNMGTYEAGATFGIGSDTWIVFPLNSVADPLPLGFALVSTVFPSSSVSSSPSSSISASASSSVSSSPSSSPSTSA